MKKKLCALKKHLCKTCAQNLCRNVHTQKCAEIVHTKMCRKCAHTKCAELCTRRFVQKCAHRVLCRSCAQSLCPSCAQSLCPRIVSTKSFRWCTTKSFMRVNIVRHVCRTFVHVCVQICANCTCPKMCPDCHMCKMSKMAQKWPKMTKIDNLAKMSQNGPKWPKMAENVPGGYMTGHRPPAISYTGWQKLPEYALIRIAAGPKVADLPLCAHVQKSPISAPRPDGKSRRFAHVQKSPLFGVHMCAKSPLFRSTPQNICASCVRTRRHSAHKTFCGTKVFRRAHITLWCLCVRGANVLIRDVHTFCKCAHIPRTCAENTRQGYEHTGHVCTPAHTRAQMCTAETHRAHPRTHVFIWESWASAWHQIFVHIIFISIVYTYESFSCRFYILFYGYSRYATLRAEQQRGDEWGNHTRVRTGTLWDLTNAQKKVVKRSIYIYIYGGWLLTDGSGDRKMSTPEWTGDTFAHDVRDLW